MSKDTMQVLETKDLQHIVDTSRRKSTTCFICRAIDTHYHSDVSRPRDVTIGGTTMPPESQLFHVHRHNG